MSTDIRGTSIRAALLGVLGKPMIFYGNADSSNLLHVGSSAYMLSDKTTLKYTDSKILPITVHGTFTMQNGLEITDPEAFVKWNVGSLLLNHMLLERDQLFNWAALIQELNEGKLLGKSGEKLELMDLTKLSNSEIFEVLKSTTGELCKLYDQVGGDFNASFALNRWLQDIGKELNSTAEAINKFASIYQHDPSVQRALEVTGMGQLMQMMPNLMLESSDKNSLSS